jgi:hypothetical protein
MAFLGHFYPKNERNFLNHILESINNYVGQGRKPNPKGVEDDTTTNRKET